MPGQSTIRKLRLLPLVAVIFFTVSGGPYGLEPLLSYAGRQGALLVLLLTPLLWDLPAILTVLELNSMMPVEGGYYKWVRHALGTRWGFYEGWWSWMYTFCDLAIYPVYISALAAFFIPALAPFKIPICLIIIWTMAAVNVLGILPVGRISLYLGAAVLLPLLVLFALFFSRHSGGLGLPSPSLRGIPFSSLSMAIYIVMWNCLGWDNVSTYAEEVNRPVRSYLVSVLTAFALVLVVYFLCIGIAQASAVDPARLRDSGFPLLGNLIGGKWLGTLIGMSGIASYLGIYGAVLLSVSRVPRAMAEDRLLPAWFSRLHPRFGTPYRSILTCSAVVSLMVLWKFEELVVIDVIVYGAGLFLEYLALLRLRQKEPERARPFRIPLNIGGLRLLTALPFAIYLLALCGVLRSEEGGARPALFAIALLLTAEAAWFLLRKLRQDPDESPANRAE